MKNFLLILVLGFCLPHMMWAQAEDPHAWTAKDVIHQESLTEADFSPEGKRVVWVKRRPSPKKDRMVSDLYLSYLDHQDKGNYREIRLTRTEEADHSPLFSQDGHMIYFLSSREKSKKLWAMSAYGGEAYPVDSFPGGIRSLHWLNDSTLVYLGEEGPTLYEAELKKKKDNVVVVEDSVHMKPVRAFAYDIKHKKRKRLTNNHFPISSYAVSKNGRWLVSAHTRSPHYPVDGKPVPVYYLWDLEAGTSRQILQSGFQTPGNFQFAWDHSGFYFTSVQSSDPEWEGAGLSILSFYDLASHQTHTVPLDWEWGLGRGYQVVGTDVLAYLANGTTYKLSYYAKANLNWQQHPVQAGKHQDHFSVVAFSKQFDQALFAYSTASHPPEYRLGGIIRSTQGLQIGEGEPFTSLNPFLKNKTFSKTESLKWIGAKEEEVTGMLYYPHHYDPARKYPLIIAIHGGPTGVDMERWSDRWAYPHNLITQKGCFILKPNYHGSGNHGRSFIESIKGHYYDLEEIDILRGIEHLDQQGLIDRDSMALMGWSNGAIIATMLTVRHPEMFKVATPGAGDVNWTSDFGTCRFGVTFDQSYFGGAPWDDRDGKFYNETYIIKSPLFEMEKVRTPTLIFHGSEDRAVPRDQGWEYYRALQQIGKAPVRFLWFPGQPHGLQKLTHQKRKIEEEMAWFEQYLWGSYEPRNEALKKESPLMALLKREKSAQDQGLLGHRMGKILVPEVDVVKADSIAIGCFEVTQAQYHSFQPDFRYPAGTDNRPVQGLSRAQVEAYLAWLSKQTSATYRLPTAAEAKALRKLALKHAAEENTLVYWAGYTPTTDEVPMLEKKLATVSSSLIKEVGKFAPVKVGQAEVYDLAGNLAEYAIEGSYGYSAYDYADPARADPQPARENLGFRVVKELK